MKRSAWIPVIACFAFHNAATAGELLLNGSFQSNGGAGTTALNNWTVVSQTGSGGSWYVQTGGVSPLSNLPVPPSPDESFTAMTDSQGPGSNVLVQSFTVPPAGTTVLTFNYAIVNLGPDFIGPNPNTLDFTAGANQQVRVDILSATAGASDVGSSSVLLNVLEPQSGATLTNGAYVPVSVDISSVVSPGGTYQLRFAEVDTQGYLLFGVDNVAISFSAGGPHAVITSLTPASGVAGTSVTIGGTNFGDAQGASTITFNGTVATPTSWSATSIVVNVPAAATSGNVVLAVGGVASNGLAFTVPGTAQSITFDKIPDQIFGILPFAIPAKASSGLPVSFASTTPAVCTVSGSTLNIVAAGVCSITASQAGNASYLPATPVSQSFTVTQASQTITFGSVGSVTVGTSPFSLSATATSGLDVTFTSTTPTVCTVATRTVAIVAVGTCSISASQPGNTNYLPATPVNESFTVTQASQTISFGPLSNVTIGVSPISIGATSTSGLTVRLTSNSPAICIINGNSAFQGTGVVTAVVSLAPGKCSITASQTGNTFYAAAPSVTQSFIVANTQIITFGSLGNVVVGTSPFTLIATATSGFTVTFTSTTPAVCTVAAKTVTIVAAGTCSVTANQAGDINWAAAPAVSQSFGVTSTVVNPQPPDVTTLSPFTGTNTSQAFAVTASDPNGAADIALVYILLNNYLGAPGACYAEYNNQTNQFRLLNDSGSTWLGPVSAGSGPVLENSQCTLNPATSFASASGNTVTANYALSFTAAFSGQKHIYILANDNERATSNWYIYGDWWPGAPAAAIVNRYRLYDPYSHTHHYTTDLNEYNTLATEGFTPEGASGQVPNNPAFTPVDIPYYRLYFIPGRNHFWTTDRNEYLTLIKSPTSYIGEGIDGFLLPALASGTIPLYRLVYCCAAITIHFWTTDPNENAVLTAPGAGWNSEASPGNLYPVATGQVTAGQSAPVQWSLISEEAGHRKSLELFRDRQSNQKVTAGRPRVAAVLNAASFESTPLAPGEAIRIPGDNLLGAELTIAGSKARILSATNTEIVALVPVTPLGLKAPVSGTAILLVDKNGASVEVTVKTANAAAAIFASDAFGKGDAIVEGSGTRGSTLRLYATGLRSGAEVSVWIGGFRAEVLSVASEPDASGRIAVEIRIPSDLKAGEHLPITLASGGSPSQSGVIVAIQ